MKIVTDDVNLSGDFKIKKNTVLFGTNKGIYYYEKSQNKNIKKLDINYEINNSIIKQIDYWNEGLAFITI